MIIFLDLDGTVLNTAHPSWKPYKDGTQDVDVSCVPIFPGAIEFINSQKEQGNTVIIISDSHPKYVNKFLTCFQVDGLYLADKPNTIRFKEFISRKTDIANVFESEDVIMVGDGRLDIEFARRLSIPSVLLLQYKLTQADQRDGLSDELVNIKIGPTYYAYSFQDLSYIINHTEECLYACEASLCGKVGIQSLIFSHIELDSRTVTLVSLARQEQGVCDKYARADQYFQISNPERSPLLISALAKGIENYLNLGWPSRTQYSWDIITYISDKSSTRPQNKMKEIFDLIDTPLAKHSLFLWKNEIESGSLRNQIDYQSRREYLSRYLFVDESVDLSNKNIIIIDDQLTTGATAYHVVDILKRRNVKNILFIALFQMCMNVADGKCCPHCGKEMQIKINRDRGTRFYSCVPPQFKGTGCGYIENID